MNRKIIKAGKAAAFRRTLLSMAVAGCFGVGVALAQPMGPQVINGSVNFASQGNILNISNTPNAIINWQSFSIAPNEVTRFIQQSGSSNVLNRVVGQESSAILGALQSNGKVYLINPNGILFGPNARVDVNGLIASTLDIANQDFLAGKYKFSAGTVAGKLDNQGAITTPGGGQIVLIATDVQNSGIITSPKGEILLAAGKSVQLVDTANPDLAIVVSAPENQALNLGQIVGQGGKVGIYGALINQRGKISADSAVVGENGKIVFKASKDTLLEAGSVTSATGVGKGGEVQVLGERVGLTGDAKVDVSGQTGGGTLLIGGDYQGKNTTVQNAQVTYVGPEARIKADAIQNGDGGKVIVWADDTSRVYGGISAKGGAQGGDGGFVETSGKHYLDVAGIRVNAGASQGQAGQWLLDPDSIDIINSSLPPNATTDVTGTPNFVVGSGLTGYLLNTDIESALYGTTGSNGADVSVYAANYVTVRSGVSISAANMVNRSLSLRTDGTVTMLSGSSITSSNAPLNVTLNSRYSGALGGQVFIDTATINTHDGNLVIGGGANPLTTPAIGLDASSSILAGTGVFLGDAAINTGTGSISIRGQGASNGGFGAGVFVENIAAAQNITGGSVTINGVGGAAGQKGILFATGSYGTVLDSSGGAMNLTGSGNSASGIYVSSGHSLLSKGGVISLTAPVGPIDILSSVSSSPQTAAAGGDITLQAAGDIMATAPISASAANSTVGGGFNGGTVQISSPAKITLNVVGAAGSNGYSGAGNVSGGNGGNVTISAAGTIEFSGGGSGVNAPGGQGYGTGLGGAGGVINVSGTIMTLGGLNSAGGQGASAPYGGAGGNITVSASGAITANDYITAMGYGDGNGGNVMILGTSLSFPNSVSDVMTNNSGQITLEATAGAIVQAGWSAGAIVQGPKAILKATTGINGGGSCPSTCNGLTINAPLLDVKNSSSGEVSLSSSSAYTFQDLNADSYSLYLGGSTSYGWFYNNNNPVSLTGGTSLGNAKLYLDAGTGNVTVGTSLSTTESIFLSGGTVAVNQNVSAKSVEFAANTISVDTVNSKSVTATGTANGDVMRFMQKNLTKIALGTEANSLEIDPMQLGTTGNTFNANAFEFDAGSTGTVYVNSNVDVPGALLAFEGGAVNVNANVTGKGVHYMTNSIIFTGTPVTTANSVLDGISIGPYTAARPIKIDSSSTGDPNFGDNTALWIATEVLNNTATPQMVGNYLEIGTSMTGGTPFNSAPITISSAVTGNAATFKNLSLVTSGDINQSAAISLPTGTDCGGLKVQGAIVTLDNILNSVDYFTSNSTGALSFTNSKTLYAGNIKTTGSAVLLAVPGTGSDIHITTPGIDACSGMTSGCTSSVTLSAYGSIYAPLVRAGSSVYLYAGGNVVDTDGALNNIVSGNGTSIGLYYDVTGNIELDAWGATILPEVMAGSANIRLSQPSSGGGGTVTPPPPTLDACVADPSAAGCSAVLPTLDACTLNPSAAGCSAVLPTLDTCAANPSAAGCSAVLPTLSTCTVNPSAAGCSAVLPTISTCTSNPSAAGCSAVLPTLVACAANPNAAGCSAVLPTINQCASNPSATGCSAVLPTLDACTANPSAAGCSAVLPTLDACAANPSAAGCSAVLPTLDACTANPSAAGCSVVLPTKLPDVIKEVAKTDESKALDQTINQTNNSLNNAAMVSVVKPLTTTALLSAPKEVSGEAAGGGGGAGTGEAPGRTAGSEKQEDKSADEKKDEKKDDKKKDTTAQKEEKKDDAPKKKQYCN